VSPVVNEVVTSPDGPAGATLPNLPRTAPLLSTAVNVTTLPGDGVPILRHKVAFTTIDWVTPLCT
jgi:hypothetical protein